MDGGVLAVETARFLPIDGTPAHSHDPRSLFSAARAHSKLREAAGLALRSISVAKLQEQQQTDSLLLYLAQHGQHVASITLEAANAHLPWRLSDVDLQLPSTMQLSSLHLTWSKIQLQPGNGSQGLLGPAAAAGASSSCGRLTAWCLTDRQGWQQRWRSCLGWST